MTRMFSSFSSVRGLKNACAYHRGRTLLLVIVVLNH
jgi:hypothetical protein